MARSSLFSLVCQEFERRYLRRELDEHGWNRKSTASDLGLSYRTLLNKIKDLGLNPSNPEEGAA